MHPPGCDCEPCLEWKDYITGTIATAMQGAAVQICQQVSSLGDKCTKPVKDHDQRHLSSDGAVWSPHSSVVIRPGPGPGPVTGGYEMSPKTYDKCDEKAHIFNGTENKGYCQCGKKHYLDPIEPVYGGSIPHPDGFGGEDFPAIKPDDTGKHLCAVHGWVDATVVRGDFVCRMCTPLRSVCGKPGLSGNATGQHVCGHEHDHVGLCGNWIWSEFKSSAQPADTDLVEALAELCHEQWSGWLKYQFDLVEMRDKTEYSVEGAGRFESGRESYPKRWRRQMNTKYADLSEMEKESDRTEARKFVALLKERGALK